MPSADKTKRISPLQWTDPHINIPKRKEMRSMFNFFKKKNVPVSTPEDEESGGMTTIYLDADGPLRDPIHPSDEDEESGVSIDLSAGGPLRNPMHPFDGDEELARDYIMVNAGKYNIDPLFNGLLAVRMDLKNHIKDYCLAASILQEPQAADLRSKSVPLINEIDNLIQYKLFSRLEEQILDENSVNLNKSSFARQETNLGRDFMFIQHMYFLDFATFNALNKQSQIYLYTHQDAERVRSNNYSEAINILKETKEAINRYLSREPFDIFLEMILLGNDSFYYRSHEELANKLLSCINRRDKHMFFKFESDSRNSIEGTFLAGSGELEPYFLRFISDMIDQNFGILSNGYMIGDNCVDSIAVKFKAKRDRDKQIVLESLRVDLLRNNKPFNSQWIYADNSFPAYQRISEILRDLVD